MATCIDLFSKVHSSVTFNDLKNASDYSRNLKGDRLRRKDLSVTPVYSIVFYSRVQRSLTASEESIDSNPEFIQTL